MENQWIICLYCKGKIHDRIREDTVVKNYPLYYSKCRKEILIKKNLQVTIINELDTLDTESMNL
ncbi:cysteine-rich KTR domain-containing protein [Longibaculum muris]|uniref:cysteine-rich KTR domain-containing protein n=1 Tax=Longibaculum muris TaxID=1796628 RepID=UPI0022E2F54E|nr:cysteine-rich KTR domain-containing protein [Longibaculum muris]